MSEKTAILYRMHTAKHICPYGIRSKDLLKRNGFNVDDRLLETREATNQFKAQHNVETTPQTFIDGVRIGGFDALQEFFGNTSATQEIKTYVPVIAIFIIALLLSLSTQYLTSTEILSVTTLLHFIALAMVLLALQKLRDVDSFVNSFITYDLLGMRSVRYAKWYPFLEAFVGFGMFVGITIWIVAPLGLFIGAVGALSVVKAVYIDRRELNCACVGGNSNVPLGFVSLSENLFMIGGAILMLIIT